MGDVGRHALKEAMLPGGNAVSTNGVCNERLESKLRKRDNLRHRLDTHPDDSSALLRLAQVQIDLDEQAEFALFARSLCRTHNPAWRTACQVLHQRMGRSLDAVAILLEVHRADANNSEVCCYLAKLIPQQAEHWYKTALQANPKCPAALLAVADVHRKAERFKEAAELYEAAHIQRPLEPRSLYRFGEALVQDGQGARGRHFLVEVLRNEADTTYHVHAAVTVALSYVMDQQHDSALEYCHRATELNVNSTDRNPLHLKLALLLKGITQLRIGDIDAAVRTLRGAAGRVDGSDALFGGSGPKRWYWDQMVQQTLGLAETIRGDFAAAERHLDSARQLAGPAPDADVLAGMAYLKQARGDLQGAENLLRKCLEVNGFSGVALLRMGYVHLCQEQFDRAIQFLQKCLQQPSGTLAFGVAQKGAAHVYLCVAQHVKSKAVLQPHQRPTVPQQYNSPVRTCFTRDPAVDVCAENPAAKAVAAEELAEQHFQSGYDMQHDLRLALAEFGAVHSGSLPLDAAARLATRKMGTLDLNRKQASILLWYAGRKGLAPSAAIYTQAAVGAGGGVAKQASIFAPAPTLVGTASTAAPASSGPSRDASDPNLGRSGGAGVAMEACGSGSSLPADKVLSLDDVELGECISCGELAIVRRGTMRKPPGREVVVKMLQPNHCMNDGSPAEDLRSEILVFADLCHPRLVTFVGACLEPQSICLVTELAHGGNLHQLLHVHRRQLSRRERFQLSTELLEGARYLHSRSPPIAHLDLKSMNLVLDRDCQHLQICDFGLARVLVCVGGTTSADATADGAQQPAQPETRGGSPRYMAPECYDSSMGELTEKADVWSCGCILIETFGNTLPYAECSNSQQIATALLVHQSGPSIPEAIEAPVRTVIGCALAFLASDRPAIPQVLLQLQAVASSSENKSRFLWIP
eukprot:TRINITY_DN43441_c0_g1_i1.p1 TRINITY_DN43441_c0_g1~~TRINITY_DN43441_c0_g1_i1.p1  ORF type:complete len:954 (-),score=165.05 TRINITY_DN43441_c0_g1_i1:304-3075(-)